MTTITVPDWFLLLVSLLLVLMLVDAALSVYLSWLKWENHRLRRKLAKLEKFDESLDFAARTLVGIEFQYSGNAPTPKIEVQDMRSWLRELIARRGQVES